MDEIIDSLDYRDVHIDFYIDDPGQQVYTNWEGRIISFGAYNTMYKEDMKSLIDKKLDTIYEFDINSGYLGTCISWFYNNGWDDIIITYRSRIIKVILMTVHREKADINAILESLIEQAKQEVDNARKYMR